MIWTSTFTSVARGLAGEAFDEGVGHDLVPGPAIPGRDGAVGVAA